MNTIIPWSTSCCNILSTLEGKYNRKRVDSQIKRLTSQKAVANYSDSDTSPRVLWNNKSRTGMLPARKQSKNNIPKHGVIQKYFLLCKKSRTTENKYMSHSSGTWFFKRSYQEYLKKGLGGNLDKRKAAVKQFYNAKNERKRDLESLKKHSNMLYIMVKRTRSRKELKKIKNIRSKVDNKYDYSNRSRFSSNTESYLLRDNEWYIRQPDERNETKKLYQIVANNIKNKDQRNNSIDYEPKFDNKFIYLVIQI